MDHKQKKENSKRQNTTRSSESITEKEDVEEYEGGIQINGKKNKIRQAREQHRENKKLYKRLNDQDYKRKKRRAWYGSKQDIRVVDNAIGANERNNPNQEGGNKASSDESTNYNWKERFIISSENQYKAVFDIFVLLMVLYSCVISVFEVSFDSMSKADVETTSRQ
jgi:hypothetical protein